MRVAPGTNRFPSATLSSGCANIRWSSDPEQRVEAAKAGVQRRKTIAIKNAGLNGRA